jgi:hypothetical protein
MGLAVAEIDSWFVERTGFPLSPAGRLFLLGKQLPPPTASRQLVVQFPTPEMAEGIVQWPETKSLVLERLGPLAISISEEAFESLPRVLAEVGIRLEPLTEPASDNSQRE